MTARYVVSAGRTGTVFLTHALSDLPGVTAVHEPSPSRWQMMLANFRNDTGLSGSLLKSWFNATQKNKFAENKHVVELNPFLPALADLIPQSGVETRIVHLVRNPKDWAQSMTTFKASTKFRYVIDYVPYSKPYPSPRPAGWSGLPEGEKALWRWVWCNGRLGQLEGQVATYRIVRFEDLFSSNAETRSIASAMLTDGLDLGQPLPDDFAGSMANRNPRPNEKTEIESDAVIRICSKLARKYNYDV